LAFTSLAFTALAGVALAGAAFFASNGFAAFGAGAFFTFNFSARTSLAFARFWASPFSSANLFLAALYSLAVSGWLAAMPNCFLYSPGACGHIFEGLKLSHRWVTCPECGLSLDRDHNAAINILNRGLSALPSYRDGQSLWAPSTLKSDVFAQEAVGF
jgi:hypothetical protein